MVPRRPHSAKGIGHLSVMNGLDSGKHAPHCQFGYLSGHWNSFYGVQVRLRMQRENMLLYRFHRRESDTFFSKPTLSQCVMNGPQALRGFGMIVLDNVEQIALIENISGATRRCGRLHGLFTC